MAEVNPPWTLEQLATHHANVNRDFMNLLNAGAEGVLATSGLGTMAVSQRGAGANMSVDVAAGVCAVFGDENNVQGLYGCVNDAVKNVVIAASDPTNPRRDLVVVRVRDAFFSGATNAWDLFIVQGTPAPSPVDPAMPNNAVCLARVAVAAAATSIVNANITDLRPFAPLGILPVNSARRPGVLYGPYSQEPAFKSVPVAGQRIYEQDTNLEYVFNGSVWVCVTPVAAATNATDTRTNTAYGDGAGGALPAVTVTTGTKALVRLSANINNSGAANSVFMGYAVSGASTIAATDNESLALAGAAGHQMQAGYESYITGLTAGVNTFTAKYRAAAGTITFSVRKISVQAVP